MIDSTMIAGGFWFPQSAVDYLHGHKGKTDSIEILCLRQIQRAAKQIEDIAHLLRERQPKKIVDIGCGLGVVDAILARDWKIDDIVLIDGDGSGEKHGEYREGGKPWNNVRTAVEFVRTNATRDCRINSRIAMTPTDLGWSLALLADTDLLISLKSWGLHYPVSMYLHTACHITAPGALLVIDLHKPEGRREIEEAGFRFVEQVGDYGDTGRALLPFVRHVFERVGR